MLFFTNKTSEVVIINYWKDSYMKDIHVDPGEIINIDSCSVREWIVLSRRYERIGKFWERPSASGLTKIMEFLNSEFDFILTGHVWFLEYSNKVEKQIPEISEGNV